MDTLARAASHSVPVGQTPIPTPKSTVRARQQLSCTACHRRKQKCDRQIPCSRCIERGVGHTCEVAPAGENKVHINRKRPLEASDTKTSHGENTSYSFLQPCLSVNALSWSPVTNDAISQQTENVIPEHPRLPGVQTNQVEGALRELVSFLPSRILCDRLLDEFFNQNWFKWMLSCSYQPQFRERYKAMWTFLPTTSAQPYTLSGQKLPVTLSFLSVVYIMLATSVQFLPDDLSYLAPNPDDFRQQLYQLSCRALSHSDQEETPDRMRIDAYLLTAIYEKNNNSPQTLVLKVSTAIRLAQSMGYHRKAQPGWRIGPLEDELRKRTWCTLYVFDRIFAMAFGNPPVINDIHTDAGMPAHIDLVDLTADGPRNIKPMHVFTDTTYLLLQYKMVKITGRLFEECFSIRQPTYATIMRFDTELHQFEASLPACFCAPSASDLQRRPEIALQFAHLTAAICRSREALHRPYLLKDPVDDEEDHFAKNRVAAINLARRSLAANRVMTGLLHPAHFIVAFTAFECGATAAIAALAQYRRLLKGAETASTAEFDLADRCLTDAIALLRFLAPKNRIAKDGCIALQALRHRYMPAETGDLAYARCSPVADLTSYGFSKNWPEDNTPLLITMDPSIWPLPAEPIPQDIADLRLHKAINAEDCSHSAVDLSWPSTMNLIHDTASWDSVLQQLSQSEIVFTPAQSNDSGTLVGENGEFDILPF